MNTTLKFNSIEEYVINVREQHVILDKDVAALYEVETKHINQAVRNNPEKFPEGYIIELTDDDILRSKFLTANISAKTRTLPKAFTEKGLYMLATILKSARATQTTIAIVETFAKIRELSRTVG